MLFETAYSHSDLSSESSSDEEYLHQVPVEKIHILKSYKRTKAQLRSIRKKKKTLLIQEKVVNEEKKLLKDLLFGPVATNTEDTRSAHIFYQKEETLKYKFDETDLLIQIQRQEQLNKALNVEELSPKITEILPSGSTKNENLNHSENEDKNISNENVMDVVQDDQNSIIPNANLSEGDLTDNKLNKTLDEKKTKSQIEQNNEQTENTKVKIINKIMKCSKLSISKYGKQIYKMVDLKNGYYINITKPIIIHAKFVIITKILLRAMKPILKEFSDCIDLDLFMYITRRALVNEIIDLLVGKEKMRSKQIVGMFREKHPDQNDGYYIISILVAIWRGDYNDDPEPDDPYNHLITERDPQKLVSYEDILNCKASWEVTTILPDGMPQTKGKKKKKKSSRKNKDSSVTSQTNLGDSYSESGTETKHENSIETDSILEINDGDNKEGVKVEVTTSHCCNYKNSPERNEKTTSKRPNETKEKEDPYTDNEIKRLRPEYVETSIEQENVTQISN